MSASFEYKPRFTDIRVKPPKPDEEKAEADVLHRKKGEKACEWPDCTRPATAKAPKSREQLADFYEFCQAHAGQYNKNWNFYAGRSEGQIRAAMVEADVVEVMVALPGQLFFNTQIPACLWFLAKQKQRKGEVLFIDARKLGTMISRVQSELTDEVIERISQTVAAWRSGTDDYQDIAGFCRSVPLAEIAQHGHVLTPGRYVGAEEVEDDEEGTTLNVTGKLTEITRILVQNLASIDEEGDADIVLTGGPLPVTVHRGDIAIATNAIDGWEAENIVVTGTTGTPYKVICLGR
jgi:hypothetical protein